MSETIQAPDTAPAGIDLPRVGIWRNYWLSPSETFIRDQMAHLSHYTPVRVGLRRLDSPLVEPDVVGFGDTLTQRVASRLPAPPAVRTRWDQALSHPRVALVHAHFAQDGMSALPVARRVGVPLVVTFHGMDITVVPKNPLLHKVYRHRLATLFDGADRLIAVSDFIAGRLGDLGAPAEKIVVHHIGTSMTLPDVTPSAQRQGIVFVGRLVQKKGVADLLEAVARLPRELRQTPVTIVGYGPLLESLRSRAGELGLVVDFAGRRTSSEIDAILARHAVFCGPSKTADDGDAEGFGMVFLEAAKAGLPVVAYRHGGVPEAVSDGITGLLAPESDVAGLTSALAALLTDPQRAAAMGERGRERVVSHFDVSEQTAVLEEIYQQSQSKNP